MIGPHTGLRCCRDWHTGSLLCRQKVAADLTSAAFTEDSSHILAAGKGTLKVCSRMNNLLVGTVPCRHTGLLMQDDIQA